MGANGEASRANRLATSGIEAAARIDSMTASGDADDGGSREYEVGLTVRPSDDGAYEATTRQYIHPSATFRVGMDVTVKVDPDDPAELILWDAVPSPEPAMTTRKEPS
jgi:hypothetical protein